MNDARDVLVAVAAATAKCAGAIEGGCGMVGPADEDGADCNDEGPCELLAEGEEGLFTNGIPNVW